MSMMPTGVNEYDAIAKTVPHYTDGAKSSRGALALAALALTAGLSACSGSMLEARPVCIKPHGGANSQLAPSDQCESGMSGHVWLNR